MTARRLLLVVGGVLLVAGIIALFVPVSASGPNGSVGCGNAISKTSEAQEKDNANPGNIPIVGGVIQQVAPDTQFSYVSECNKSLFKRRAWSIPLAVVGVLLAAGAFLVRDRPVAR